MPCYASVRLSSIVRDGRFASKLTDDEFDRNRIIQQEQQRDINRSLKLGFGLPFSIIQDPVDGRSLIWKKIGAFWTIANGPDAWGEVLRLDQEIIDRKAGDEAERLARMAADAKERGERIAGDQRLQAQIDGLNHELNDFANDVARVEAARLEAETSAANTSALIEAAATGFTGTTDGIAYDYGWTKDPFTYFDRDYGWTKDPVTD